MKPNLSPYVEVYRIYRFPHDIPTIMFKQHHHRQIQTDIHKLLVRRTQSQQRVHIHYVPNPIDKLIHYNHLHLIILNNHYYTKQMNILQPRRIDENFKSINIMKSLFKFVFFLLFSVIITDRYSICIYTHIFILSLGKIIFVHVFYCIN